MNIRSLSNALKQNWKAVLYIGLAGIWLAWDIHHAQSDTSGLYKTSVLASSATFKSPAATTVAIVRSNDALLSNPCNVTDDQITYATVSQMVRRAVELTGGLSRIIKIGDTVLIKPNLVQQDSSGSGGVTDVRVVKALVYLIDEIAPGKIKIIVGDGSARPYTSFERNTGTNKAAWAQLFDVPGYQALKTEALASGIDFRLSNLNGNSDVNPWAELDSVVVPNSQATPQNGAYFVHKDVTHASVYISVPVLKIHEQPGFTNALKNQIGLAAGSKYGFSKTSGVAQEGYKHKLLHNAQDPYDWQDKEIVDLSTIARIKYTVVDALVCLETQKTPQYNAGDRSNRKISNRIVMNTILAGEDPVAVDNVGCRIIGVNPDDIEHITLAERVGLGTNSPDSITIVGATIEQTKRRFKKPTGQQGLYGQSNRVWLLTGPFVAASNADMNTPLITPEASVSPVAGQNAWSQPIYFTNDQIMLKDYFGVGSSGKYVSYAFTYVNAPADQQAVLWIGSDEDIKVYLNEQAVYTYTGMRTFTSEYFKDTSTVINLKKGVNKLLVKAYQSTGSYNFSLNICEVEPNTMYRGSRVSGLKFTTSNTIVGVNQNAANQPAAFSLSDCYPNPFNPTTRISYTVGVRSAVTIKIFDIAGREVRVLVDNERQAGSYDVLWNASSFSSGVYFCRFVAQPQERSGGHAVTLVKKMMLMK
ncbi:MAG: DUF362 domain-containing protein [Ignavibacteriae bacterium]|nr:MAG: DUF362 domain-containing protein [Ignavibacteriota bacterium]